MAHLSPQVCLAWAIMSVLLGVFCVWYLWRCEKFRCIKYDGTRSGRSRLIMIYLYISSILTLVPFSTGLAAMKYMEGLIVVGAEGTIVPNPLESWSPIHRKAFCVLNVLFSLSWALEIIIHLGELFRWNLLFNAMSREGLWLKSSRMHTWIVGSIMVVLYMPIVAQIGCDDAMRCQSWTLVAGSLGSLVPTLGFVPMLVRFPAYIREMETREVDQSTLSQLINFQELNRLRLASRLVFIASFLSLGLDLAQDAHPLTVHAFWTDTLGFFGSVGYVSSSVLTLTICFPRQVGFQSKSPTQPSERWNDNQTVVSNVTSLDTSVDHGEIVEVARSFPVHEPTFARRQMPSLPTMVEEVTRPPESHTRAPMRELPPMVLEPNRRKVEPVRELEEQASPLSATSQKLARSFRPPSLKRKS